MLSTLLAIGVAATPVDVIAVPGDRGVVKKALAKALPGTTLVDETAVWSYLHAKSILGFQDFDQFAAAPIATWPKELARTWRDGLTSCRELSPTPLKPDAVAASAACANRLSDFLWTKLLEHRSARDVYVVFTRKDEKNVWQLDGAAYKPLEASVVSVHEESDEAGLEKAATRLVAALVARKGTRGPREVVVELESRPSPGVDLLASDPVVSDPVPNAKTCPAAPATLDVTPDSVLARTLTARWAASVKGTGAKGGCTLALTQHEENSVMGTVTVVRAMAKCGATTATAEGVKSGLAKGSLGSRLSEKLVRDLASAFCP